MSHYRRARVAGSLYFFTVNLADRQSSLLLERIEILRAAYRATRAAFPFETVAICVLPDHLHALWRLPEQDDDFSIRWQRIKATFSAALPVQRGRTQSKERKREKGIWQRRFWEHLIHDDKDLQRHVDYVHYNPVKHGWAKQVADWPYSSFHRYARRGDLTVNWGGSDDDGRAYGE